MKTINQIELPYLERICCSDAHGEKGRTTKLALMEAAITLFMKKGFNNTPVREICALANVSKGTFYLYFEAKEHVIDAIYEYLYHSMELAFSQMKQPELSLNGLMQSLDRLVMLMKENRSLLQFVHHPQIMSIGSKALWEVESKHMEPLLQVWAFQAMDQGIIRDDLTKETITLIYQMVHDALEKALLDTNELALDFKVPLIKDLLVRMLLP